MECPCKALYVYLPWWLLVLCAVACMQRLLLYLLQSEMKVKDVCVERGVHNT